MVSMMIDILRLIFGFPFMVLGFTILGARNSESLIKCLGDKIKKE